ncbi:MAG: CDP-glycerol glycerophosphotransferase family protein, partial [Selenomonadaceae bacterium]|nr:CDP-glycerol glycerophosphotransferase family protein [Selenomonadaceae bacterium]
TTVAELKRKDRIKVAFVTDHAATWCGDKLYNMFANNPRFEPTIFLCRSEESTLDDSRHDFEQFKSRGLNAVAVFDENEETEPQDVIIFLRPYTDILPKNFRPAAMTPQTLWAHILYGFKVSSMDFDATQPLYRLAWKIFFETVAALKFFDKHCAIGVHRGVVSGYPRLDVLFDAAKQFSFPWKMTRPDATKIIWAPHWTIFDEDSPYYYGTFQHNFRFMYEFAKSHPETSWVVKPHPRLAFIAVKKGLFESAEAYEDYLQAWNDLPNAQVFTGGYYHDIFATSDGMIQDSGSFLAEYQYTHKPMIYLTRDERPFNELGKRILDVSYCVDGRDFDGIAALIRKVFVDGNDPLKDARQKLFDELLNYVKRNGMFASEFIFRAIADELEV